MISPLLNQLERENYTGLQSVDRYLSIELAVNVWWQGMDDWVKVQLYKLFLVLFMLWIGLDAVYEYFLGRSPLAWGGLALMFVGFAVLAFSTWNITQSKLRKVNLKVGTISATLYSAGFVMNFVSWEYQMWFVLSFSLVFVLFVVFLIIFAWRREAKRESYTGL